MWNGYHFTSLALSCPPSVFMVGEYLPKYLKAQLPWFLGKEIIRKAG
jgi:hypothetical protein